MSEVDKADAMVNAAFSRVRGLDRFSRSAPIGRAELATIVLHGLAELGALADWTVMPTVTDSVLGLLDEDERRKYQEFQGSVRRAAENARSAEEQSPSNWIVSGVAEVEIDPAPRSDSRTATLKTSSRTTTSQRGRPKPSCISSTTRSSTRPRSWWSVRRRPGNACGRSCGLLPL